MREALARGLAGADDGVLAKLAVAVESAVRRSVRATDGVPGHVMVGGVPAHGPWLGYLLLSGVGCWLALGWAPVAEAGRVRERLPLVLDDDFRLGPIAGPPGLEAPFEAVLGWGGCTPASRPADHRLLNDLHAMVMLRDLLAEDAERYG